MPDQTVNVIKAVLAAKSADDRSEIAAMLAAARVPEKQLARFGL
jgi:hypothetical protein